MKEIKRMALLLFTVTAVFLMLSTGAFAVAEVGVVTGDLVNLRAKPDISSKIITQLEKGINVSVTGSEGDWYQVSYNDNTGWMNKNYLSVRDQAISAGTVTGSVVNVRSKPDISSEILTKLTKGSAVEIYERSGDWYRISIGEDRYGWIHKDYLSVRSDSVSRGKSDAADRAEAAAAETADENAEVDTEASDENAEAPENPAADSDGTQSVESGDYRQKIVAYARTLMGVRYVYGGSTTKGFDCSGFVSYVFKKFNIPLERSSKDMANYGTAVKKADLQPGDLVFFDTNGGLNGINHVGIYIGNNQFIHASSGTARKVTINNLNDKFYSNKFMRARDYLTE